MGHPTRNHPCSVVIALLGAGLTLFASTSALAQSLVRGAGVSYSAVQTRSGSRYTVVSSELIERVTGAKQTVVLGTRSYDRTSYGLLSTFPSAHLGWNPYGLQGSWDYFNRFRGGHPYGLPRWNAYPGTYQGGVVVGYSQRLDSSDLQIDERMTASVAPDVAPETTLELLARYMGNGDYSGAIDAFDAFGSIVGDASGPWPDDRLRAIAMLGLGKVDDAAGALEEAYLIEPRFAGTPLSGEAIAPSNRALRDLVTDAVEHAHRNDGAANWLLVAVLMQIEGRTAFAAKMIGRARDRGLDDDLVVAFEGAIGPLPAPESD